MREPVIAGVIARASATRCPTCRDELGQGPHDRCARCGVSQHAACAGELGGCATFGCARAAARPRPRDLAHRDALLAGLRARAGQDEPSDGRGVRRSIVASYTLAASIPAAVVASCVAFGLAGGYGALMLALVFVALSAVLCLIGGVTAIFAIALGAGRSRAWALGALLCNGLPWLLLALVCFA